MSFIILFFFCADSSKDSDKGKKEALGAFYNFPHYVKIYEVLKSVNASYKVKKLFPKPVELTSPILSKPIP